MLHKIMIAAAAGVFALSAGTASAQYDASKVITAPYIKEAMKTNALTVEDKTVRTECGDCHMVFAPQRLTQNAWRKIMATLKNHFGDDASLDATTAKHIEDYLVANALDRPGPNGKIGIRTKMRVAAWAKKGFVDPLRITETPEWTRHHTQARHYLDMAKEVGYDGGSNCIMCHRGAEHALFEEFSGLYGDVGGE